MVNKQENSRLPDLWSWFSVTCVHCARMAWYIGLMLFVIAVVAITVFRFWLPALVDRKAEVENYLSRQVGQTVVIGEMAADWQGIYPTLHARKLILKDVDGKEDVQLSLDELRLDLDLLPLLQGKLVFRQIALKNPVVNVSRSLNGDFYIGKFKAPKPKKGRLALLFRQYKVSILGGRFIWHDNMLAEKKLEINDINLSMENIANSHFIEGRISLPDAIAKSVAVKFHINGKVTDTESWNGSLETTIEQLQIAKLPGIVTEKLSLPTVSGVVSIDVLSDWVNGNLAKSAGRISTRNLEIPLGKFGSSFLLKSAEADLQYEDNGDSRTLQLENTVLAFTGKPWDAGLIQAVYSDKKSSVDIEKVKLADIRPVLDALSSPNKIVQLVKDLYPSGNATATRLTLFGPIKKPTDFLYEMSVTDATVNAYQVYPAATGIKATISVNKFGGSVIAEGKKSRIVLEKVYTRALVMDDLQAEVNWSKAGDVWKVNGDRVWLKNADVEAIASFVATIPVDHNLPPLLRLNVDLKNGDLSAADHYYPVLLMQPGIHKWFDDARFQGNLKSAKLLYEGTVKGFPVKGAQRFDVLADIQAGSMIFAPDWPRLYGIDAELTVGKNDLWVKGRADNLYGQKVADSTVHISKLAETNKQVVDVSTLLKGDLSRVINFLQSGTLFKDASFQDLNLAAKGYGEIGLDISIPLSNSSQASVNGEYTTSKAALKLPDDSWISDLKGKLHFTEKSLWSRSLHGTKLGGPLHLRVKTVKEGQPPVVEVQAEGVAYADHLTDFLGEWLTQELEGSAPWQGKILFAADKISLNVESDLVGLSSKFPYPLTKSAKEKLPLKLDVSFLSGNKINLAFTMPFFANGKLFFSPKGEEIALTGGCVLVGNKQVACKSKKGLSLSVEHSELDLDPWDRYIKSQSGDDGIPAVITRMQAKIGEAYYSKVNMADVALAIDRQPDNSWKGKVQGERVAGSLSFNFDLSEPWVKAHLTKLIWNEAEEDVESELPVPPNTFLALDVVIDSLIFHEMNFGTMSLSGGPAEKNWDLHYLKLDRPDMKVRASGQWKEGSRQRTVLDVDFTSTDMLSTLLALDFNLDFESEEFHTTGDISWSGAPYDYNLANLSGTLDIHSESGRLSGVDVGAGRLLGAFNVDSLRRRLSLDFTDLSEEGFAFDTINADVSIKQGTANVSKLIMSGPSAAIKLKGRLGLVEETVDMQMSILPALGGNLAIAGYVLGGPAGGVVTYIASKAIKNRIENSKNYQYTILGPWADPKVEKKPVIEIVDDTDNL